MKTMDGVAIIGMAGKFPGLDNINDYWKAIIEGKELLKTFSDDELKENGADNATLKNKYFVPVNGLINTAEFFDSSFFGFTPREADLTDPQHRKFLEVCYEGLEHAGQSPDNYPGSIGVFAGCSMNNYLLKNLLQFPELLKNNGEFQTLINNDKDFLTTKVSYKLNLTGPSLDIQTACSTSLVAIHVACQNLLNYQCDVALGGGAFIMNPRGHGYFYKPGGFESPDGICRPFDKDANGTVLGEGIGVIVLKRLEDAIADKDEIWAVIKSSAINNDGAFKIGYMAPSENGQSEVISKALEFGEIDPKTISYVEAHGTGTKLGDPIELSGLSNAFRKYTDENNFCAIGSVKGNIGHCESAAGVAGIIKTAMALKYKKIPPSINFNSANPELNIESSPFYVNTELKDWEKKEHPRRASVSSFGIGGTNAHCILEEWESDKSIASEKELHILPLSSKSAASLDVMTENLIQYLKTSNQEIGDIAYTLQRGRNSYIHKTLLLGRNIKEIVENYESLGNQGLVKRAQPMADPTTVFMFTGQGSQYVNMAKGLYEAFDIFKNIVDNAHDILLSASKINLLELLFNDSSDKEHHKNINLTSNAQPLLFTIQYATACLLIDIGIFPDALIGHSTGQITAATLSGVFAFEDALRFLAIRGKMMQNQKSGLMLSINLSPEKLLPYINGSKVEFALHNAPEYCVVSGPAKDINDFHDFLKKEDEDIHTTLLKAPGAYHSSAMDPVLEPIMEFLKEIDLGKPEIPFISNVSGTWIEEEEACSPKYWTDHIRSTVKFSDGISEIFQSEDEVIFLELGPGNSLSLLLSQFENQNSYEPISTIRHPQIESDDVLTFYKAITHFWISGGRINWDEMYEDEVRYKVPLPTYPFKKKRHWIDPKVNLNYYTGSEQNSISSSSTHKSVEENILKIEPILHSRPNISSTYKAPSNSTEEKIVNIWQELLGIENIGVKDNFFELGGHSLLAAQLIVRINELFNIRIPLEGLFKKPCIQDIVTEYQLGSSHGTNAEIIEKLDLETEYPISIEQQRLWILNKIDDENPSYNIPFANRFFGKLDIGLFQKAIEILFNRHKILNSYIPVINSEPQIRFSKSKPKVNVIDISNNISAGKKDSYVQEILGKESRKLFNLETGPLYRLILLNFSSSEFIFHLTIHHSIFDGWSWGIFSHELNLIYNSLKKGLAIPLAEPKYQYIDFSYWQSKQSETEFYKESLEFWRLNLANVPAETNFPYDNKRPELLSGYGGREDFYIDKSLTNKLKKISTEHDVTLFMTVLTAFGVLINLYSGDDDICIGAPTANRVKSDFEKIIGFFVNTIIFRLKIENGNTFSEILNANRKLILDSLEYQNIPFETLVEIVQPERKLNINPLFQIMFSWQNTPRQNLGLEGVTEENITVKDCISPLDITFYMWEANDRIEGEIEFNTDILKRESILHLKNNFVQILQEIVFKQNAPIANHNYLSEYTFSFIEKFNNTKFDLPQSSLHELFVNRVDEYSDKTALVCDGESLTYSELHILSNKLANKLIESGIKIGAIVGIGLTPTLQQIVAVFGVLKTGACYLPMDPSFPEERLQYIIKDSGAEFVIAHDYVIENLKLDSNVRTIAFDSFEIIKSFPVEIENPRKINQESLAYIIYTSGSTGNPKGVLISHTAVVNFILSMSKTPGITHDDNLLSVTTLSFDISVLEIFLPLSFGATIILANDIDRTNNTMHELIDEYNITILQATPATWNILLNSPWEGSPDLKALCGGEAMLPKLAERLIPNVGELWNMYGPTETTVWSSCKKITDAEPPIGIGSPIGNTQFYILDDFNKKLPVGVYGEIVIGGNGIAQEYHNRAELTLERFITVDGEKVYKTGDTGRIRYDGELEILGRLDNQIKLRGFRIEPGEIEARLYQINGIIEAVVKVHKFSEFDERLIAFLKIESSYKLNKEKIYVQMEKYLPGYMIPSDYLLVEEFPRTPNGKTDRKKLLYDPELLSSVDEDVTQEDNSVESRLLSLWRKELKSNSITTEDNFFDVGGHSLLAIALLNRIEKEFGLTIKFRDFISDLNSVKRISELITRKTEVPEEDNSKYLEVRDRHEYLYCVQPNGTKPPIFQIYSSLSFFTENESLGNDRPVYDFVWPGSDGMSFPMHTVEEIAQTYLDEILSIYPKGPFYLLGFSFGGLVAFEIALKLQKMGLKTPIIFLIDTRNPKLKIKNIQKYKEKIKKHGLFKLVATRGFNVVKHQIKEKFINAEIYSFHKLKKKLPVRIRRNMIYNESIKIGSNYIPGFYNGKIQLFKSKVNSIKDEFLGWQSHISDIIKIELEGNHTDARDLKNNKLKIAKELKKIIKEVEG